MDETYDPDFGRMLAHSSWLTALAREIVRDPALADDVVQDTWVAALRAPRGIVTSERGWLATLLANVVRSRGRSESARRARERSTARAESVDGPDRLVERAETQRALLAHVLALPEPYRGTLLERYVEDRSCAEIARRADVSESTVRTRLARAHERLRARLAGADGRGAAWALAPLLEDGAGTALKTWTGVAIVSTTTKCALAAAIAALAWWMWPGDATEPREAEVASSVDAPVARPREVASVDAPLDDARRTVEVAADPAAVASPIAPVVDAVAAVEIPNTSLEVGFRDGDRPVPNVRVWIAPSARWPIQYCLSLRARAPTDASSAVTDGAGIARFADLGPGNYRIGFDPSHDAEIPRRFATADLPSGRRWTIPLGRGAVRGRVVDQAGVARADVGVQVVDVAPEPRAPYVSAHATTDAFGEYAIDGLAEGLYEVVLDADGDFDGRGDTERRRIELADGERRVVDFGSHAGTTTWTGRVLSSSGEPFRYAARVTFTERATDESVTLSTAADGSFARALTNGTWQVRVWSESAPHPGFDVGTHVLEGGDVHRDLVVAGTRLIGRVLGDLATEVNPATGARYCIVIARFPEWGPHFDQSAYVTFPGGEYRIDGLRPGKWLVGIDGPDPEFTEVVVDTGQSVLTLDVRARAR